MPAWATLVVDTAAPHLVWGGVGSAYAGTLLRVGYTLDKPGITAATILLPDGRELPVTVTPSRLEVLLPADTPDGPATVRVELADDIGNTATVDHVLPVGGAAPAVEPRRPGIGPSGQQQTRRQTRQARLVRAPADPVVVVFGPGRITDASTVDAGEVAIAVDFAPGTARVRRSPASRVRMEEVAVRVLGGDGRINGRYREVVAAPELEVGETAVLKRDGPDLEEALLLGLL